MLKLNSMKDDIVVYDFYEDKKVIGSICLRNINQYTLYIENTLSYKKSNQTGTKMIKELFLKHPNITFKGKSRYKYVKFWQNLGAEFEFLPTDEDIELDEDGDEEGCEYIPFVIKNMA